MKYYLDASALVKRFKPEKGQETVRKILHETSLGIHEAHSIYWVKAEFFVAMRRGGVSQRLARRDMRALSKVVFFDAILLDAIDDALNLIYELNLHAADAVHLAACKKLACESLVTDDEHLIKEDVRKYLERYSIQLVSLKESV